MIQINTNKRLSLLIGLCCTVLLAACGHDDDDPIGGNEGEVISTVELSFTPTSGGTATIVRFDDPDGDGGQAPTIDDLVLAPGDYDLALRFENGLESPPEDITVEVSDESSEHQLFFTGSAVDGPATDNLGAALLHQYADQDDNGFPVGLQNTVVARQGQGELVVTLRHLPPIGNEMVKTITLSEELRLSGFSGIGGASDVQVTFSVSVP